MASRAINWLHLSNMYGGVSLCIYINGVAQELLEMAKATAPEGGGVAIAKEELSASARFYRRLGQYLDSDSMDAALLFEDSESAQIRTRFVVDVLSGTSAGGLNSIFLAKALVNNEDMPPNHIGHNKFLVYANKSGKARAVLFGSTNWTPTGLCAQTNNTLIVDDPKLANRYLKYWKHLVADTKAAGGVAKALQGEKLRT